MVRMERLELSRLAAAEPKSTVYTNFTTSAKIEPEVYRLWEISGNLLVWIDNEHVLKICDQAQKSRFLLTW